MIIIIIYSRGIRIKYEQFLGFRVFKFWKNRLNNDGDNSKTRKSFGIQIEKKFHGVQLDKKQRFNEMVQYSKIIP